VKRFIRKLSFKMYIWSLGLTEKQYLYLISEHEKDLIQCDRKRRRGMNTMVRDALRKTNKDFSIHTYCRIGMTCTKNITELLKTSCVS